MNLVRHLLLVSALLLVTSGCVTDAPINSNLSGGRELAGRIRLFNENDLADGYPLTLDELRSLGNYQDLPKCKCEDGKLRDFIYVRGFPATAPTDYAVLISPPEMHKQKAIVVYLNLTAKVCSKTEAESEVERSKAFIKSVK
jgi:hypothetical protein